MLELAPAEAAIVRCFGEPEALDRLPAPAWAFPCRVARDELLLLALGARPADLLERARPHLGGGFAVDHTDGWSAWTISGPDTHECFARLSSIALPRARPAFLQGAVAGVEAKVVALDDRLHVLVPASLGHHLRDRVLSACADLEPRVPA